MEQPWPPVSQSSPVSQTTSSDSFPVTTPPVQSQASRAHAQWLSHAVTSCTASSTASNINPHYSYSGPAPWMGHVSGVDPLHPYLSGYQGASGLQMLQHSFSPAPYGYSSFQHGHFSHLYRPALPPAYGQAESMPADSQVPVPRRSRRSAGAPRRSRTTFTHEQLSILERTFQTRQYPDETEREDLARRLNGPDAQVINTWFKNRRAKHRREARSQEGSNVQAQSSAAATLGLGGSDIRPVQLHPSPSVTATATRATAFHPVISVPRLQSLSSETMNLPPIAAAGSTQQLSFFSRLGESRAVVGESSQQSMGSQPLLREDSSSQGFELSSGQREGVPSSTFTRSDSETRTAESAADSDADDD